MEQGGKARATRSLLKQVALVFVISTLAAGLVTYFFQRGTTERMVRRQIEEIAASVGQEVEHSLREYPAWDWLIRFWQEHDSELSIEYDADFSGGRRTARKEQTLRNHQPYFQVSYANGGAAELLPEEDQRLFAEIVYSWVLDRLNEIKLTYRIDYLFVILTDPGYQEQYFLLSAADAGEVRGTEYEQVYPLGTVVSVADNEHQREAMRAAERGSVLLFAGKYADYYDYICDIHGQRLMVGLTYNMSDIIESINERTVQSTGTAVVFQLVLSAVLMAMTTVFFLRPFRSVQQNIRLYTESKNSGDVERNLKRLAEGKTEISLLSRDVIGMTREIDEHVRRIEAITADRERLGAELELASRIQANSLPTDFPPFPERSEFDIYAFMDPAKEVGGDFYDFFFLDEDHLALVIADVSGKGVPAALFMMVSMILIHTSAGGRLSPAEILESVNDQICGNNPEEMFVTVWMGILEVSSGRLTAANAGHEYPAHRRADGHFEMLQDRHGFVIGAMPGMKYRDYTLELAPGDKLFVYTDGLPEATDGEQRMFGPARMLDALRSRETGSQKQILEGVAAAVADFVGDAPQFDDLTMLGLTYFGPDEQGGGKPARSGREPEPKKEAE